jgi:hypothetical protein
MYRGSGKTAVPFSLILPFDFPQIGRGNRGTLFPDLL